MAECCGAAEKPEKQNGSDCSEPRASGWSARQLRCLGHGGPQARLGLVHHLCVVVGARALHCDARTFDARFVRQPFELKLELSGLLKRVGQSGGLAGWGLDFHRFWRPLG